MNKIIIIEKLIIDLSPDLFEFKMLKIKNIMYYTSGGFERGRRATW